MKGITLLFTFFQIIFVFTQNKTNITFDLVSFSNPLYNDFSPTIYKKGLLFVSDRNPNNEFYDLFYSDFKTKPTKIKIKENELNVGQIFCDDINHNIYLTKSSSIASSEGVFNLAIFKGKINNKKISKLSKLYFCNPEYSYGQVFLTKKNKEMLILSSEGVGFSLQKYIIRNNNWIKSETIYTDKFPMLNPIYKDQNTILFSSKRENGIGGFDLYKIIKKNHKWSEPINLTDFNSKFDDLSILYINDKEGYISSNRINNKDHIFKFKINYYAN